MSELSLHQQDALEEESGDTERGNNEHPQTVNETNFCEEEKTLLESSCAEDNRTACSVEKVDSPSTEEVVESHGERQEEDKEEMRRREANEMDVKVLTLIINTTEQKPSHRKRCGRLLKKMLLDLRVFFWLAN